MAPTTPPECVNEKERGQEESTAEVLTEGNEGLRLHLFWPSTLPAGPPPWFFSLLLASVTGAGGQRLLRRSPHLVFTRGRKTGNAGGSICQGLAAVSAGPPGGEGGGGCARAYAAQARGSRSGGARRGTSHVTRQLVRLSLL